MQAAGGRSDLAAGFTARVADAVLAIRSAAIGPQTLERVRHAVLDWTGVTVAGGPSEVTVVLKDGASLAASVEANVPVPDSGLAGQWSQLVSKFTGLVDPVLGAGRSRRLIDLVGDLASMDSIVPLSAATAPHKETRT
jgi:hypothetical protein